MPYYSKRSVEVYGKPPGPWKLFDTGGFWKGLTVAEINAKGWRLTSTDSKTEMILGRFASREFGSSSDKEKAAAYIFGLNKEKGQCYEKITVCIYVFVDVFVGSGNDDSDRG
jgi:hypothetical protein